MNEDQDVPRSSAHALLSVGASPAGASSRFDAPLGIPYNRGILSARRRARRRLVYKVVEDRIRKALRHHIHERYKTDVPIATERPPKLAMGEAASPVCFELAKRLKKPPRSLAQEIANSLKPIPGVARVEVAGAGYLN